MRTLIRLCAVLLASLPTFALVPAAQLDPADYVSRSGEYSLHVEPSEPGGGEGTYTLTRNGTQTWSGQLPYTLEDVDVGDDGSFVGYGEISRPWEHSLLVVVHVSSTGELLNQHTVVQDVQMIHGPAYPLAKDVLIHPENGLYLVLLKDRDQEELWWAFALEGAGDPELIRPLDRFGLDSSTTACAARPVPGTPLTLVHWSDNDYPVYGGSFALYDEHWNEVWHLELPGDYTDLERDERFAIWREGGVLSTGPHAFEIRLARESVRLSLRAVEDPVEPGGWIVTEVGREPYADPPPVVPTPEAVDLELAHLGSVQLGTVRSKQDDVVRDIQAFGVELGGEMSFVRWEEDERTYSLVRLDAEGKLLIAQPIEALLPGLLVHARWTWLSESLYLATVQEADDAPLRAWTIDSATGSVFELSQFVESGPFGDSVAASAGGRIVIANRHGVTCLEGDGTRAWIWEGDGASIGGYWSGIEDVAVTSEGAVLAFHKSAERTYVLSPEGALQSTIELREVLPQELNYPTDVIADRDGGFLLVDFHGDPPIWRLGVDGTLRGSMNLSSPGMTLADDLEDELILAPDERLWTTDGNALFSVDEAGVVDRIVGAPPSVERIDTPGGACVDSLGRILVSDRRSRAVHVFDRTGQRLAVCESEPDDFRTGRINVAAASDGSVFLRDAFASLEERVVEFGPDGERRGVVEFGRGEFEFQPGTTTRWQRTDFAALERVQADGVRGPRIDHLPDGRWLRQISDFTVAPNGEVAVVDLLGRGGMPTGSRLSTYDVHGVGQSSILLPEEVTTWAVARNDDWIAFAAGDRVAHLVRTRDLALFRVEVRGKEGAAGYPGFSPDGREVWWVDGTRLDRFALPQQ